MTNAMSHLFDLFCCLLFSPRLLALSRMSMIPIFALMLAPSPPIPINDAQMRDIGCVAAIGIIAHEQREGGEALKNYTDVRETGKRWAGIVGARVMEESGQPREVVALAIKKAVEAEQAQVWKLDDPAKASAYVRSRFDECKAVMDAQLGAADAATPTASVDNSASMLAAEPEWQTDEPGRIALYRKQLSEDLASPQRIRFCAGILASTSNEISGREGDASRDATAFGRIARALKLKADGLPKSDKPNGALAEEHLHNLKTEHEKEEVVARCIRLGESLALAVPPESMPE